MEDTPHCLLAGDGALKFAKKIGFPVLDNPVELATKESYERSRDGENYLGAAEKYVYAGAVEDVGTVTGQGFDTVGAVALDSNGRLASATSTGMVHIQCKLIIAAAKGAKIHKAVQKDSVKGGEIMKG